MNLTRPVRLAAVPILVLFSAGCSSGGGGGGTQPPPPPVGCASPTAISLAVGGHVVVDPATSNGCIRFPSIASGGADQEYYATVVSGSGLVTTSGVSGSYTVKAGAPAAAAPPAQVRIGPDRPSLDNAGLFHRNLRNLESALAADPSRRATLQAPPVATVPPLVGSQQTFNVCANLQCSAFTPVTAIARYVGTSAAVYLDLTVPGVDTLNQFDLNELGQAFDLRLHPISRAAFGSESDIDGSTVVAILLTDAVNALTPDCTNGRILGYFWGGDLLTVTGSNRAEIFYGMVPSPATSGCTAASRRSTVDRLKPTMIHELQHMISFHQHVFVSGGSSGEVTWLNEALSHYAEELGGRLIPNSECPTFPSCRSQYTSGNLNNAYDYLEDPEANFLVFPSTSVGTLPERGAAWLFVRWLADHWGTDSLGTNLTRALVQTSLTGATNVQIATATPFATLVAEWLTAVWVDDLPGFTPLSDRMRYKSWGFRKVFADNCCATDSPFPRAWPSDAPLVVGNFTRSSTLRGGSGRVHQVIQTGGSPALDFTLAGDVGGNPLHSALAARIAVVRIR